MILENLVYRLDDTEFKFRQGQQVFTFSKTCRPAVEPRQPLFSEYWEYFTGVKPRGCENDLPLLSSAEVKKELS